MTKRLGYKQKTAINILVIILGLITWYFMQGAPYLSEKHRFDSLMKANFASKSEVIYMVQEEEDPHGETHYILNYGDDYAYFNLYNYRSGHSGRFGPTRNAVDLYFEDGLSVVAMGGEHNESQTSADVAVVCINENVEKVILEYHNGNIIVTQVAERKTDKVFEAAVIIPEMRLGLEHWSAEYRSECFTAKGYDKDGNLIAVNKCQAQIMEEK